MDTSQRLRDDELGWRSKECMEAMSTRVGGWLDVTVQGSGLLSANIVSAEPLTAALFPVASQAETACDEFTSGRDFRS